MDYRASIYRNNATGEESITIKSSYKSSYHNDENDVGKELEEILSDYNKIINCKKYFIALYCVYGNPLDENGCYTKEYTIHDVEDAKNIVNGCIHFWYSSEFTSSFSQVPVAQVINRDLIDKIIMADSHYIVRYVDVISESYLSPDQMVSNSKNKFAKSFAKKHFKRLSEEQKLMYLCSEEHKYNFTVK